MTRKDYMDGKVTHAEYYTSVAKAAGVSFETSNMLPKIKKALASGDDHLNSIPLSYWNGLAYAAKFSTALAFKAHEDFWSLAGGVCVAKQAAKNAAESTI